MGGFYERLVGSYKEISWKSVFDRKAVSHSLTEAEAVEIPAHL